MWARRYWLETAWALFALANTLVVFTSADWETVPFHFVWVSLTLVYGFRVWGLKTTSAVLIIVTAATGVALGRAAIEPGGPGIDEVAEVPLMAAMFLAMVWHARRRERALQEVRRLAEKDRAFARDASHLLRTPIAVARGHAELIRESHAGEQEGEDAAVILDELERLTRISHRLLILASADNPSFLRMEPLDLEELVVGIARRWGPAAVRHWHVDPRADGTVTADPEQLCYALDALIDNAVRHTGRDDRISVVACVEAGAAVIEVADTGDGIQADRLPFIFERFQRAGDNYRRSGGAGLGLPIVRAIAEAHGGSVSVTSVLGGGTTFRIRLPGYVGTEQETLVKALRQARRRTRAAVGRGR